MLKNTMNIEEKRELYRRLKEKETREEDYKMLRKFKPTVIQRPFLLSKAKIRIGGGGNRPGKTEAFTVDQLIQMTSIIPDSLKDGYPVEFLRPGRYWASARNNKKAREVSKPKIDKYLPKSLLNRFHELRSVYYFKDGQELGLKSMEEGVIGFEGDSRYLIWLDEEHTEEVYKACYMRTIDCSGRITMSFTPTEGLTWAYDRLFKRAKLKYFTKNIHGIKEEYGVVHTLEEIKKLKDRKLYIEHNTSENADDNIEFFQFTMYDNPYLPDVEIQNAEKEHKDDIAQYQARILGLFAKLTGRQVYSVELIYKGRAKCPNTYERGEVQDGKFIPSKNGRLIIFKKKKPIGEGSYVIAGDPSEGLETGDDSAAQIIDHATKEQVAVWCGKVPPEEFGLILIQLGLYYNYALLMPERNGHGFGVVSVILKNKYKRLYCSDDPDLRIDKKSEQTKYGWHTNANTKPLMVQTLGTFLSEGHLRINDPDTWDQLLTYVYHPNGKTGALKGCKDDKAIAMMIAIIGSITRKPRLSSFFNKGKTNTNTILKPDKYTGY